MEVANHVIASIKQQVGFSDPNILWDDSPMPKDPQKGFYVAISGNTGAGKSSLIQAILKLAASSNKEIIGISERSLHHPYLRLMFSNPAQFAFPIQLNFMLQRNLVLRRHLNLGRAVVIERSHLDDEMFIMEHYRQGMITDIQLEAYQNLAKILNCDLPVIDIVALLDVSPEVSLERVNYAEKTGDRPKEFPNEEVKMAWIERWHGMYNELHDQIRFRAIHNDTFKHCKVLNLNSTRSTLELAIEIYTHIKQGYEVE